MTLSGREQNVRFRVVGSRSGQTWLQQKLGIRQSQPARVMVGATSLTPPRKATVCPATFTVAMHGLLT